MIRKAGGFSTKPNYVLNRLNNPEQSIDSPAFSSLFPFCRQLRQPLRANQNSRETREIVRQQCSAEQ